MTTLLLTKTRSRVLKPRNGASSQPCDLDYLVSPQWHSPLPIAEEVNSTSNVTKELASLMKNQAGKGMKPSPRGRDLWR